MLLFVKSIPWNWILPLVVLLVLWGILIYVFCVYKKHEDRVKGTADILAVSLLFCCALGILYAASSMIKPKSGSIPRHEMTLTASIDTTKSAAEQFRFYSDSSIRVIKHYESLLDERYSNLIDEKESTMRIQSVIGILISIIVAIVGFFGYTNIKSIEKKAINLAKENVEKEVGKYLKDNLTGIIRDALKSNFSDYLDEKVANRIASQVKGELIKTIVEETEAKIQEDLVRFFTVSVNEKKEQEQGVNNPFIKG